MTDNILPQSNLVITGPADGGREHLFEEFISQALEEGNGVTVIGALSDPLLYDFLDLVAGSAESENTPTVANTLLSAASELERIRSVVEARLVSGEVFQGDPRDLEYVFVDHFRSFTPRIPKRKRTDTDSQLAGALADIAIDHLKFIGQHGPQVGVIVVHLADHLYGARLTQRAADFTRLETDTEDARRHAAEEGFETTEHVVPVLLTLPCGHSDVWLLDMEGEDLPTPDFVDEVTRSVLNEAAALLLSYGYEISPTEQPRY